MNNNELNNESNNYVSPTRVDTQNIDPSNSNGFLNRERENIVSATIQANTSLNENEARTVNNAIKVEKENPAKKVLLSIGLIILAIVITFGVVKIVKLAVKKDQEASNTTTTTTQQLNTVSNYLNNKKIVRKFRNGNRILLLSPEVSGVKNYYLLIEMDSNAIISQEVGEYSIENNVLSMNGENGSERVLKAGDKALVTDGTIFAIEDSEMKFFVGPSSYLLLNASTNCEIGLFASAESKMVGKIQETDSYILMDNSYVFNKSGNTVDFNGEILNQG